MKRISLFAAIIFIVSGFYLAIEDATQLWSRKAYPTQALWNGYRDGIMTGLFYFSLTIIVIIMIWELVKIILPIIKKRRESKRKDTDDK